MNIRLFRKRRAESVQAEPPQGPQAVPRSMETARLRVAEFAPGTELRYHDDLIGRFHGHHQSLQQLFGSIKTHATNDEFAEAQKSLQAFRRVLTSHLLEENIKLYTYLSKCLAEDPANKDLMTSMKTEMGQIGNVVMHFVNEYTRAGLTPFNKRQFLNELDEIGATLVDRIEREESSLYTLYMPPSAYD